MFLIQAKNLDQCILFVQPSGTTSAFIPPQMFLFSPCADCTQSIIALLYYYKIISIVSSTVELLYLLALAPGLVLGLCVCGLSSWHAAEQYTSAQILTTSIDLQEKNKKK